MTETERKDYDDLFINIQLLRNISIFINFFAFVQLVVVVILPDLLPSLLKTWLIVITCGALIGIIIGLILSQSDPKTTQFFIIISVFISGLVLGISIVTIIVKVK